MGVLFPTEMNVSLTLPDNKELTLALGATSIVNLSASQALSIIGLLATGGNTNGMVVCFSNVSSSAFSIGFLAENDSNASAATVTNRFRLTTTVTVAQFGAVWFRYNGIASRWQPLSKV